MDKNITTMLKVIGVSAALAAAIAGAVLMMKKHAEKVPEIEGTVTIKP